MRAEYVIIFMLNNYLLNGGTHNMHFDSTYCMIDIFDKIKTKYPDFIKPEIVSAHIIQTYDAVGLETVEEFKVPGANKRIVRRVTLDYCENHINELFFNPENPIEDNTRKFVEEYDLISIVIKTQLFSEEACEKIFKEHYDE